MRMLVVVVLLSGLAAACGDFEKEAEAHSSTLHGEVIAADAGREECVPLVGQAQSCPFVYRVRIQNPTDRDKYIQGCFSTLRVWLPIEPPPGALVAAHSTRTLSASANLPFLKGAANQLVGSAFCSDATLSPSPHT
jgi:hypothetical protein